MAKLKLHNSMWPGLVGKGDKPSEEPPISLNRMLKFTADARCGDERFDGVDLFLFHPHIDPSNDDDSIRRMADDIASFGLGVGSLVAPVWPGTVGDSAMGDEVAQGKFLVAVRTACDIACILDRHGIRKSGVIRVDSAEFGVEKWRQDAKGNTRRIATTFRTAAKIAADRGQRLAAEGEICWAGMQSWRDMLNLLEEVGMPESLGFQADMAHTYLYLLGYNAPEYALLQPGYSDEEFWVAYKQMVDQLRPWTIDFHVAQNDGTVKGAGSHNRTGKHCMPNDPNGKLDIVRCAQYWLQGAAERRMNHVCWDGCMFSNATLENPETWNTILQAMVAVRDAC